MVRKSIDSSGASVPPFLTKCFDMVDDELTDQVISWSEANNSFVIWDMTQFTVQLLPKYFKHSNFSSFMRQLNIYGFRKVDTDRWEFANDGFVKGQRHLLKNITRRKNSQALEQRKSSQTSDKSIGAGEEIEDFVLWKEVESLKTGKNALMQELVKLSQHHESTQNKLLVLGERLQGMETNQQQMLSFLVMAVQSPGFLVQLLQPKENNWRVPEAGKNMLQEVTGDGESEVSDGMIVRYQPLMDGNLKSLPAPISDSKEPPESDLSDKMKDFFMNIDFLTMPIDENLLSSEHHGPLTLSGLPDGDKVLEQLLLSMPLLDSNVIDAEQNSQELDDSGVGLESTVFGTQLEESQDFEFLRNQMEKFQNLGMESVVVDETQVENSQNLAVLTGQMEHLTSETYSKHDSV